MVANRRINWSGITRTVFGAVFNFFTIIIGGMGLFLYSMISSDIESDRHTEENAELIDSLTGENPEDQRYELESHSIVRVNEQINGQRMMTAYNFRDQVIVIDGPDEADRVIQFSEFDNQDAIDRALTIGCRISANAPDLLSAFQQEHDRIHPVAEELISYSTSFRQQYCLTQG